VLPKGTKPARGSVSEQGQLIELTGYPELGVAAGSEGMVVDLAAAEG
jgi:hypothetical protein